MRPLSLRNNFAIIASHQCIAYACKERFFRLFVSDFCSERRIRIRIYSQDLKFSAHNLYFRLRPSGPANPLRYIGFNLYVVYFCFINSAGGSEDPILCFVARLH
eukprot:TRINITY_DN3767_c0_g1_i1.p3 TRINITY_DN3767_c0_g1~~TRINITY_DN3767_c0_g1_i1.p3  ORF type:complete len:104 (-),score=4.38 TRINITY_DN3767_c0_g1_i1:1014-1325(-)